MSQRHHNLSKQKPSFPCAKTTQPVQAEQTFANVARQGPATRAQINTATKQKIFTLQNRVYGKTAMTSECIKKKQMHYSDSN